MKNKQWIGLIISLIGISLMLYDIVNKHNDLNYRNKFVIIGLFMCLGGAFIMISKPKKTDIR